MLFKKEGKDSLSAINSDFVLGHHSYRGDFALKEGFQSYFEIL